LHANADTFFYFAYGSNLLTARLRERTPTARVVGPSVLERHGLRWHNSGADGSGKCDVVACHDAQSRVLGVVYEIHARDKPRLDAAESLGVCYGERVADVLLADRTLQASLYYGLKTDPTLVPYDWYKALVLAGAREHGFDLHYVADMQCVPCKVDSDSTRATHHFRLSENI
jgi:hypothetical protein